MTVQKHLKQLVRARMQKTGERYAAARRHVIRKAPQPHTDPATRWHFPGNVPATTALRVLLAHAGVQAPHTGEPFSEAMLFGLAGGIGWGVFSFFYEKENSASFFLAGRHNWQDDLGYLRSVLKRLGIEDVVRESAGAKAAFTQLRDALAEHGPCVAWVDLAHLPHRAMPGFWSGGGYHVITVYRIDEQQQTALIGDRTDSPLTIALADLAKARERIKKQRHRLLSVAAGDGPKKLEPLVRDALRACHQGVAMKMAPSNFQIGTLKIWAERMHGSKDKERWERVFAPGKNLWRGLASIHDFIEHYGTGGGLCRPIFAEFLSEAGEALKDRRLVKLSKDYADLGRLWSDLAHAALPDNVPLLRETRELHTRKAELTSGGGPVEEIRGIWNRLAEIEGEAGRRFPLSDADAAGLRASLQQRILTIHQAETAAHAELGNCL